MHALLTRLSALALLLPVATTAWGQAPSPNAPIAIDDDAAPIGINCVTATERLHTAGQPDAEHNVDYRLPATPAQ
jgi:hypothetical protein